MISLLCPNVNNQLLPRELSFTVFERAKRERTLGITIRFANKSVRCHTKSDDITQPKKTDTADKSI